MGSTLVVEIGGMSGALSAIVNDYVKTETAKANAAVEIGAKVCRAQIAATAPRKTGEYAAGWRTKVEETYGAKTATVYQSGKPGLPHLLEMLRQIIFHPTFLPDAVNRQKAKTAANVRISLSKVGFIANHTAGPGICHLSDHKCIFSISLIVTSG